MLVIFKQIGTITQKLIKLKRNLRIIIMMNMLFLKNLIIPDQKICCKIQTILASEGDISNFAKQILKIN